jgi:hypothetical protein
MARHVAKAEDVVQEALLRVHSALEEGQRIQSPRATSGIGCRSRSSLIRRAETGSRARSCSMAKPG